MYASGNISQWKKQRAGKIPLPISIRGSNFEEIQYCWTAAVILGLHHGLYSPGDVKVKLGGPDRGRESEITGQLSSTYFRWFFNSRENLDSFFTPRSLYATTFKEHLTTEMIEIRDNTEENMKHLPLNESSWLHDRNEVTVSEELVNNAFEEYKSYVTSIPFCVLHYHSSTGIQRAQELLNQIRRSDNYLLQQVLEYIFNPANGNLNAHSFRTILCNHLQDAGVRIHSFEDLHPKYHEFDITQIRIQNSLFSRDDSLMNSYCLFDGKIMTFRNALKTSNSALKKSEELRRKILEKIIYDACIYPIKLFLNYKQLFNLNKRDFARNYGIYDMSRLNDAFLNPCLSSVKDDPTDAPFEMVFLVDMSHQIYYYCALDEIDSYLKRHKAILDDRAKWRSYVAIMEMESAERIRKIRLACQYPVARIPTPPAKIKLWSVSVHEANLFRDNIELWRIIHNSKNNIDEEHMAHIVSMKLIQYPSSVFPAYNSPGM